MYGKGLSVACVPFYPCGDRYVPGGYRKDPYTIEQKLEQVAGLGDVTGVELSYPAEFEDPAKMAAILKNVGLQPSNLEVELFGSPEWKYGAFSSPDKKIRAKAVDLSCRCMDAAAEMGCEQISLWPGQDGFDYAMQINYTDAWNWIMEGVSKVAGHRSDVRIAIEYKIKEPRTHIHFATVGKVLLTALEIKADHVGVMIDFGHATMAYENVAESASLAARYNKLFHLHLNDNFRYWDDDMIVGSVHLWETVELFYHIQQFGYEGWYSLDIFPYREDSIPALRSSLDMVKKCYQIAASLDTKIINELQQHSDAAGLNNYLREKILR